MTRSMLFAVALMACMALVAPHLASAAESYDNCTGFITSVPATISTQGTWCMKQDLSTALTNGVAISVNTNNVTIDCNDFQLVGTAGASTLSKGINASGRLNIRVRHCDIQGFFVGVNLAGAGSGHAVEDNRFDGNTGAGVLVIGDGSVVQRNHVANTGPSTLDAIARGIWAQGSIDITDNSVTGVTAQSGGNGSAYGIYTDGNTHGRIFGNSVRAISKDGSGSAYGIGNANSGRVIIHDNNLFGDASVSSIGVSCTTFDGAVKDNVISGFAFARFICQDSGGNDVVP